MSKFEREARNLVCLIEDAILAKDYQKADQLADEALKNIYNIGYIDAKSEFGVIEPEPEKAEAPF